MRVTAQLHQHRPSDLQRHCAWISAAMFHSSRRHDVKSNGCGPLPPIVWQYRQFVCLLSTGEASQFPTPAHNDLPSHVTSSIVLHRHSRFSDSVSKRSYFPVHTRASSLDFQSLTASNCRPTLNLQRCEPGSDE